MSLVTSATIHFDTSYIIEIVASNWRVRSVTRKLEGRFVAHVTLSYMYHHLIYHMISLAGVFCKQKVGRSFPYIRLLIYILPTTVMSYPYIFTYNCHIKEDIVTLVGVFFPRKLVVEVLALLL